MLDPLDIWTHKYGSVFSPHWWDVQKQATCHASGRARLSISGAAIAAGQLLRGRTHTCTTRLKAPLSLASES